MRILVTGADGFLGRYLVPRLTQAGHQVLLFSVGDGDIAQAAPQVSNIDHVFHLAALTYVPNSWKDPATFYRVNVMGTENVLELCRACGASITYMSTYVYGHPQYLPVDEDHPVAPTSPYNHSKHLAEELCRFYSSAFGLRACALRAFNIYGYGQAPQFLIPEIIAQALDSATTGITLLDTTPKRDYVYIHDVVDALCLSLRMTDGFSVYNIGSGRSHSVMEVAEEILRLCRTDKPIRDAAQSRPNEVMDVVADINRAKDDLDWSPSWTLTAGLEDMIRQYAL